MELWIAIIFLGISIISGMVWMNNRDWKWLKSPVAHSSNTGWHPQEFNPPSVSTIHSLLIGLKNGHHTLSCSHRSDCNCFFIFLFSFHYFFFIISITTMLEAFFFVPPRIQSTGLFSDVCFSSVPFDLFRLFYASVFHFWAGIQTEASFALAFISSPARFLFHSLFFLLAYTCFTKIRRWIDISRKKISFVEPRSKREVISLFQSSYELVWLYSINLTCSAQLKYQITIWNYE